jgi:hypothetical protein
MSDPLSAVSLSSSPETKEQDLGAHGPHAADANGGATAGKD